MHAEQLDDHASRPITLYARAGWSFYASVDAACSAVAIVGRECNEAPAPVEATVSSLPSLPGYHHTVLDETASRRSRCCLHARRGAPHPRHDMHQRARAHQLHAVPREHTCSRHVHHRCLHHQSLHTRHLALHVLRSLSSRPASMWNLTQSILTIVPDATCPAADQCYTSEARSSLSWRIGPTVVPTLVASTLESSILRHK